jgi:mutator protein MutT
VDKLAERVRGHLTRFERRAAPLGELRAAAVAVPLLADDAGRPCFLITLRASRMNRHAGQFAFPGGRLDPGETIEQAGLRELREEVGLVVSPDDVLGHLDDYVTRSGYRITPLVVHVRNAAELDPNPDEVAQAHLVPITALDHPDIPRLRSIPESDRTVLSIPLDDPLGVAIHAPTAALILQLRDVALRGLSTRVAHYDAPVFAWS